MGEDGFYMSVFANGTELADYCWKKKVADDDLYLGTGEDAILKDEITVGDAVGENFLASGVVWPKPVLKEILRHQKLKYLLITSILQVMWRRMIIICLNSKFILIHQKAR